MNMIYEERMEEITPKIEKLIVLTEDYHINRNLTAATEATDILYDLLYNDKIILEVKL